MVAQRPLAIHHTREPCNLEMKKLENYLTLDLNSKNRTTLLIHIRSFPIPIPIEKVVIFSRLP